MPTPPLGTSSIHTAGAAPSLVVATGGSATAAGTTTSTTGSVDVSAHATGHASVAVGGTTFQAEAAGTSSTPTADATTFLNVSGADVTVVRESGGSTQGSTDASAGSALHFVAIANGSSNPNGPIVIDVQQPYHADASVGDASTGNYAQVSAAADAHGAGTTAATVSDATTVENQFSLVHATSLIAV